MGSSLFDLLDQTLVLTASPSARLVSSDLPFKSLGQRPSAAASLPSARRIWEFEQNGIDTVRNVTVRNRLMRDMRMPVCREIKWGEVKVVYQGRALTLPLEERFLLRTHYLEEGRIAESNVGFWQLPMNLDQSFQRIFGFQLKDGRIQPLAESEVESRSLMSSPSPVAFMRARAEMAPQSIPVLRVLVCMALGCVKESNDFEPGGVLGAARLIPHLMIVANLPVDTMEASISVSRAPTTAHTRMDKEEMSPTISSALFADRNDILHPFPHWDNLFDYYWVDPPLGIEVKVVRRDRPMLRAKVGLVNAVDVRASRGSSWIAGQKPRQIKKLPRQGEFDNLHLAPKMKLPPSILNKIPDSWPREAVMAPFCVHDCLHMHWRWGSSSVLGSPKWVRGWKGAVPYQEAGAPMVPSNQDVSIKMLSAHGFEYKARIDAPVVGQWQVVLHHGLAYALSYNEKATNLAAAVNDALTPDMRGESREDGKWANFYWHLRYTLAPHPLRGVVPTEALLRTMNAEDSYAERLAWSAVNFKAARDL